MRSLTIIDSKIPKKLHEINQEAKHLFPYYFINNGRVIPFDNDKWNPMHGVHYMELPDTLSIPSLHKLDNTEEYKKLSVVFSSISLFNALRDTKKKDIISFDCTDMDVYMTTKDAPIQIGVIASNEYAFNHLSDKTCRILNFKERDDHEFYATFTQTIIDNLLVKCITLDWSGFKIRMSKSLIPNLKKKDKIGVYFKDGEEGCFNAIFEVTKESGLKIYHSYDFLNY